MLKYNNVAIKIFTDHSKNKIVIISCLDNLIKGASGQAIQNMNLMYDFNELISGLVKILINTKINY